VLSLAGFLTGIPDYGRRAQFVPAHYWRPTGACSLPILRRTASPTPGAT